MMIRETRATFPVRSAGDGLTPTTDFHVRRPVMSTAVLADTVDLMRLLERRLDGRHCQQPEAAQAAFERLEVWARARAWEVPASVVVKADRVLQTAEHAYSTISAACWLESLPDEILGLLDRRRPACIAARSAVAAGAAAALDSPGVVVTARAAQAAKRGVEVVRAPRRRASDR